jgi:alanine-glyoxylate transaminase/serine-glyoxylate transaminase/serine-pyruvate transaminase
MCLAALGIAELALNEAGARVEFGAGVAAAQAYYAETRDGAGAVAAAAE